MVCIGEALEGLEAPDCASGGEAELSGGDSIPRPPSLGRPRVSEARSSTAPWPLTHHGALLLAPVMLEINEHMPFDFHDFIVNGAGCVRISAVA